MNSIPQTLVINHMCLLLYVVRNLHLIKWMRLIKVFKYVILVLFSSKIRIHSLVPPGYRLALPCMYFVHLSLLDHSMPHYVSKTLTIKA